MPKLYRLVKRHGKEHVEELLDTLQAFFVCDNNLKLAFVDNDNSCGIASAALTAAFLDGLSAYLRHTPHVQPVVAEALWRAAQTNSAYTAGQLRDSALYASKGSGNRPFYFVDRLEEAVTCGLAANNISSGIWTSARRWNSWKLSRAS